jgi:hypothetical protein
LSNLLGLVIWSGFFGNKSLGELGALKFDC